VFLFLEVPQLSFLMKLASQPSFDEAVSRRSIFSPTPLLLSKEEESHIPDCGQL